MRRGYPPEGSTQADAPSLITRTPLAIEIWKSNVQWFRRTPDERRVLVRMLADTLRKEDSVTPEMNGGPFLIEKVDHHLLIWTSSRGAGLQKAYDSIGLPKYFEPITYVTLRPDFSAQDLVRILSA